MNPRILIQVTTPAVLIGLLLLASCFVGAWYVSRLQTNLSRVLSENVASQKAAQELEIRLRQLQYHSLLYLMDPTAKRREFIDDDHKALEKSLEATQASAITSEQQQLVQQIEKNYQEYNEEINQLVAKAKDQGSLSDLVKLADAHPLRKVVGPFQELLELNRQNTEQVHAESQRVARQAR